MTLIPSAVTLVLLLALLAVLTAVLAHFRAEHKHRLLNENIADKMPSGMITVSRQGRISGHNPASERIFGGQLAPNALFSSIVRESDSLQALLDRCLTAGEIFTRVEFNAPVPQGFKRIGINLSPITNARGEIEGAICLLSDLTEIVELQQQVKLRENFAALGEMSAGIAHEFKNSVATILGYAQLSLVETDVHTLHAYAAEIQKESKSLSMVVMDFLHFARPIDATIHEVDLNELLESVISDLRSHKPGSYAIKFNSESPAIVPGDVTLLRQSFLNLLINAVEAMEESGCITVAVERVVEHGTHSVRVTVEDNGRGVPADQIAKIFFPFFTTKAHGTGLGLSLVQKIVIAHNGRIDVQSNGVRGTRFLVMLPLAGKS